MTCLCLPRLRALLGGLLPTAALRVAVPPVMTTLAASLAAAPSAAAGLDLRAALRLGLPPLPVPPALVEQIAATATATSQLALGLGVDLLHPDGPARLALTLRSLHTNLPRLLPLPVALSADLAGRMNLSLALSTIAGVRASLGIDLLAPGAALALRPALAATLGAPAPALSPVQLRLAARLSAYARLALAAQGLGGIACLLPALDLLARLELPRFGLSVAPLASLSLLLGLRHQIQAVLGIDPLSAQLQARLTAALRPLWALPALQFQLPVAGAPAWPALPASFALDAQALAGLGPGLGALARLQLPNLAPFSLVASLAAAGGLAAADCCGAG
jgi:hypothetical protein